MPSFQIRYIFKNFEENISEPEKFLSKLITQILEILSIKKIRITKYELIKNFFPKLFIFITNSQHN